MKFLQNKYTVLYYKLINGKYDLSVYTEKHHIIPESLGGTNDKSNMKHLPSRVHFLCHYLLPKMLNKKSKAWYKMVKAITMMKASSNYQDRYFNSRLYEVYRSAFSEAQSFMQSGNKNSQFGKCWIYSIELEKCIKVNNLDKDKYLNDGWEAGRVLDFSKLYENCKCCNNIFFKGKKSSRLFCSEICKNSKADMINRNKEKVFLELYSIYGSANKALKEMGYPGNVGDHNVWVKRLLSK